MKMDNNISDLVANVLNIDNNLSASSKLLGSIPEFDSMAVVSIITALEEEFGILIDDDELSADIFSTIGSLAEFVNQKMNQ